MMKNSTIVVVTLIIISCLLISGCTGTVQTNQENTNTSDKISKLVIGTTNVVEDINLGDLNFAIFTDRLIRPSLVTIDEDGYYQPYLAESWETPDPKTYIFHLVKNATWEDGTPLTSHDVNFTVYYRMGKLPTWQEQWPYLESIETPDDHTVVFHLDTPCPGFLFSMEETGIIPMHVFQNIDDPLKFNDKSCALSAGPYVFDELDTQSGIVKLKQNERFWGKLPNVVDIDVRMYKNRDTMLLALQKGDIDITFQRITYSYVDSILKNSELQVKTYNNNMEISKILYINNNRQPYDNKDLRTAMSYAIDYNEVNNLLAGGYGEIANAGMLPESAPHYIETRKMSQDINKSMAILDSLGFKDIDNDGYREMPNGNKFRPKLIVYDPEGSDNYRLAQLVKKYFNSVGIDLQFDVMDFNTYYGKRLDRDFDMWIGQANAWTFTDGNGYYTSAFDDRRAGPCVVTDPEYLAMVDNLAVTTDEARIGEIVADMQRYYAENMPAIPMISSASIYPYNKKYDGWKYNFVWGILNLETMYNLKPTND